MASSDQTDETAAKQPGSTPQTTPKNLPPRHPKFVGRGDEMRELHQLVNKYRVVAITQPADQHTLGGFGKTSLAIHYGWKLLDQFRGGVLFVNAGSGLLMAEIAKLAGILGLDLQSDEKRGATIVRRHLSAAKPSLMILDGLDDSRVWADARRAKIIPQDNCRVLITTNCESLSGATTFTIGGLPREQGIRALAAYRADALDEDNESIVGEIVEWFDGYPVGLSLVGCFMSLNADVAWSEFFRRFATLEKPRRGKSADDFVPLVHAVFDEVLESLPPQQRLAMEYATLLPTNRVVLSWLMPLVQSNEATKLAKILGKLETGKKVLAQLLSLQLLRAYAPGCAVIGMPHILHAHMMNQFEQGKFQQEDVHDQLVDVTQQRESSGNINTLRNEVTSMVEFVKDLRSHRKYQVGAEMARQTALILNRLGRLYEVIDLLDVYLDDTVVDQVAPKTVSMLLSEKATALNSTGDPQQARHLMDRALQLDQRNRNTDDPVLAEHYANMANIQRSLGELRKAQRFLHQAMEIEEKHFAPDHPKLGLRQWTMGDIELADNHSDEACLHYRRAQQVLAKHYPADHRYLRQLAENLKQLQSEN